jgi:hypothetical protein
MIGGRKKFHGGKHYSRVLALIGFVVLAAAVIGRSTVGEDPDFFVVCLVSFASGAQNGMTTFFSGAIVRTTHVTGTLTDIGIEIAALVLRRRWSDTWKLEILLCFFICFFLGGIIGTVCALTFPESALFIPACVYLIMSLGNFVFFHFHVSPAPAHPSPVEASTDLAAGNEAGNVELDGSFDDDIEYDEPDDFCSDIENSAPNSGSLDLENMGHSMGPSGESSMSLEKLQARSELQAQLGDGIEDI